MNQTVSAAVGLLLAAASLHVAAQVPESTVESISMPDKVETPIGTLEALNGVPTEDTARKVADTLVFTHALNVFNNSFRGASAYAIRQGMRSIGVEDNTVLLYPKLMDSTPLWLTGNADTIYYMSSLDLSKGPLVIEQPPMGLGTINDMWFSWVIDVGFSGPDRGAGGKYLIVPPGYDGPLPEGGFFVAHAKTNHALYAVRSFLVDNAPEPTVELIKKNLKIYPYTPGGFGTSFATALEGETRLSRDPQVAETKFVDASGKAFNTIPPSDFGFFEMIDANVQDEPADSYDVELAGQLAAIGIVKGKAFEPDARMKKILTDAAAVGNAAGRTLTYRYQEANPGWAQYPDSRWGSMLWQGGAYFETPPPLFESGMFKPLPPTGARTLDSRTAFYYGAILDSPAMIMRMPSAGSQYLMGYQDSAGQPFDGARTYRVTLPKDIPAAKFWSLTLYDNQTRSMLKTPQKFPRAGSQSYPSPAAEPAANGATTVWFSPQQPKGVPRGNWIQTMPGQGWFVLLRLYSPGESFFTKAWRPGEIERVD
ncbi:DUF1254 domain-containing protein [Pseudomonas sp. NPDC077649]|uniref:DUF1254 domain-containing protein n=1 Tax=Pseudomonas sp. NPDC077649 TaxID=3364423 RepID=UPI0037CB44EB